MQSMTTALLRPGEADRVLAGHPWIYAGSILRLTGPAADGDVVQIKDHRQRFLGIGLFNSKSKIHIRWLAPDRVAINRAFFEQRLRDALAVRRRHMPDATSYRVVNAESDFLSGLIVDKYEESLVLQVSSLGMDRRKADIVAALEAVLAPRTIVERSDVASRKFEGLLPAQGTLWGPETATVQAKVNGLLFEVSLLEGHKTGLYLDQQVNYLRVAELARGIPNANVLDCFAFTGGFGLHAARAGAARVHMLDQSEEALAIARRQADANGLGACCSFEACNVFDWLKTRTATGPHEKLLPVFDVIVLDPPSFTRNRAAVPDALRGYKEIHLRALKLLKPGGLLATFCCSHHVDARTFLDVLLSAAFDARKVLRRVATFSQSPDHPVLPSIPETEYLKGYAIELAR
ncbi:MAG TPA: class I SAM-dependent rRNA methyltransferase [Candidatus Paceibacterota bacterium]|nr:class I SAM-dependent rRNA methyltransferase [Candidatus Paceibacterota bacterium]